MSKFPANRDLLIDKINFYIENARYADAISYLQTAINQDPKNDQLPSVLGMAYYQINDTLNARKAYEAALQLNPNNPEANRGLGGLIFNRSKPIQEQINALGVTKEELKKSDALELKRNAIFLEAKPYLEKALQARPDDDEIRKVLNTIEAKTRK